MHLLLLFRTVDDDADGKEVVDSLEAALLFLHLLPNGVDTLRTAFDMTVDACSLHFLLDRTDKSVDIGIARSLRLIQFLTNHIIGIVLHVFQRQVLQLALQLIEAEFMGQRRIKIGCLLRYLLTGFLIIRIAYLTHQIQTVGNHNQHHPHVLSKRQQQVAEVLTFYGGGLFIELLDTVKTFENTGHRLTILIADLL